jgi:hypothetical protein
MRNIVNIIQYITDKIALYRSPYGVAQLPDGKWVACYVGYHNDYYLFADPEQGIRETGLTELATSYNDRRNAVLLCEGHSAQERLKHAKENPKKEKVKV